MNRAVSLTAPPRASGSSTSNATAFTFGQIKTESLTATEQRINLEDVVKKVGEDLSQIDTEYTNPAKTPSDLEI
jgi:hypothetical protein